MNNPPQSSKLDDPLNMLNGRACDLVCWLTHKDDDQHKAKSEIKALIEEVIGPDEPRNETDEISVDNFKAIRNDLRAAQRQRKDAL